MGTSGSYGGSTRKAWQDARVDSSGISPGGGGGPAATPSEVEQTVQSILDALAGDDAELSSPGLVSDRPLAAVIGTATAIAALPFVGNPRTARAGGSHLGGPGTSITGGGRRSRRTVDGARRVGAGLGAGFALLHGDGSFLSQFGLSLAELRALTPAGQAQAVVDRVFGGAATPADYAARKALAKALEVIVGKRPDEVDHHAVVRAAATEYIFGQAVVEIQAQLIEGAMNHTEAIDSEAQVRQIIDGVVGRLPDLQPAAGPLAPADCHRIFARVVKMVIDFVRARR
jgi:hypothetical protein